MIKVMLSAFLDPDEEICPWKANDVVMSVINEIFKHAEMITQFSFFFEEDPDTKGHRSVVKFQMHDQKLLQPSHSNEERTYIVHDTTSSLVEQREIFHNICTTYETKDPDFEI
jgi:hypothetical protein